MRTIILIARREIWEQAQKTGEYTQSTIGATLADVGFIHCSFPGQTIEIANRKYRGHNDLVLLFVDEDKVKASVKHEGAVSGRPGTFPHIYGPLNVDAVYAIVPLQREGQATFAVPDRLKEVRQG
jgi:glutathione S-transferase